MEAGEADTTVGVVAIVDMAGVAVATVDMVDGEATAAGEGVTASTAGPTTMAVSTGGRFTATVMAIRASDMALVTADTAIPATHTAAATGATVADMVEVDTADMVDTGTAAAIGNPVVGTNPFQ